MARVYATIAPAKSPRFLHANPSAWKASARVVASADTDDAAGMDMDDGDVDDAPAALVGECDDRSAPPGTDGRRTAPARHSTRAAVREERRGEVAARGSARCAHLCQGLLRSAQQWQHEQQTRDRE
jgi:hypothetical protein